MRPDRQVAFRCMSIRGQEILAEAHRQTRGNPRKPSSWHLRRRRRHRAPSSSVTRHAIRRRVIAHRCCGHIMRGRVAPEAPCKAAWLAAMSASLNFLSHCQKMAGSDVIVSELTLSLSENPLRTQHTQSPRHVYSRRRHCGRKVR